MSVSAMRSPLLLARDFHLNFIFPKHVELDLFLGSCGRCGGAEAFFLY